jgi:hypothetical protein
MLLQVHDELVFDLAPDEKDELVPQILDAMRNRPAAPERCPRRGRARHRPELACIPDIDISSFLCVSVTVALGARANEGAGFENFEVAENDGFEIYATIDGGERQWVGSFAPPQAGAVSGEPIGDLYLDADFDQFGEGARLTEALADFTFPVSGEGSSMKIEIEATTSGSFETIALDNVRVSGHLDPYPAWVAAFSSLSGPAETDKDANPDGDALANFGEFALDGDPSSGTTSGKHVMKIASVGGAGVLTLTFPVRKGAQPAENDPPGEALVLEQPEECIRYSVQAGIGLSSFTADVSEVNGPDAVTIQAGLPPTGADWEYRTFRSVGTVSGTPAAFMRVRIEPAIP